MGSDQQALGWDSSTSPWAHHTQQNTDQPTPAVCPVSPRDMSDEEYYEEEEEEEEVEEEEEEEEEYEKDKQNAGGGGGGGMGGKRPDGGMGNVGDARREMTKTK